MKLIEILLAFALALPVEASAAGNCQKSPAGAWVAMSERGAPVVSTQTPVVWTGKKLLVFGAPAGGIFDPCANRWRRMSTAGLPKGTWESLRPRRFVAGDHVVFFGFGNGGEVPFSTDGVTAIIYNVMTDRWSAVTGHPEVLRWRRGALVVAAGREVIVWGGVREQNPGGGGAAILLSDGARLDPATGKWRPMSQENAPSARTYARAVWTGTRLVVWGGMAQRSPYQCGDDCQPTGGGAAYDPATDTWTPMNEEGAPSPRSGFSMKQIGDLVLVWGGVKHPDGALYDPNANRWRALPPPPKPIAASMLDHFEVVVGVGKFTVITNTRQAAVYDVAGESWTAVPVAELPVGPTDLRGLGEGGPQLTMTYPPPNTLGVGWLARVDAATARWEVAPLSEKAPTSLKQGVVAWTGEQLLVWGPRPQEIQYVEVPDAKDNCGRRDPNEPDQPICDPAVPVREVRLGRGGMEGGLFRPVFAPARLR